VFSTCEDHTDVIKRTSEQTCNNGAIELGENLLPGDYVLQMIVTDRSAAKKKNIATQYVQFEVLP